MKGFIIDTNKYAGNFEREMCAYLTGVIGECGVGNDLMNINTKINGVIQQPDDNNFFRPCSIYPTPNYYNNGLGFQYQEGEEELALLKYKEYVIKEETKWMELEENHRGKNVPTWTDSAIDNSIKRRKEKIKDVSNKTQVDKYPSYQSVIIFFKDDSLTEEVMNIMKERAYMFLEKKVGKMFNYHPDLDIKIEKFRVVHIKD
jgi:hypothetical protein